MTNVGTPDSGPDELLRRSEVLCYVADIGTPTISDEDRHHLVDVLRLRVGANIALSDGLGSWRSAQITSLPTASRRARKMLIADEDLELALAAEVVTVSRTEPSLTVAFAIPKGDRLDLVVQKLTELGIDTIVPLITKRTVVRIADGEVTRRTERLQRIAREASSQSRRVYLPNVAEPTTLERFLENAPAGTALAEPGGVRLDAKVHCVITGPEGGWDEEELLSDVPRIGLGPTILRAETAAIAVGVLMHALRANIISYG